MPVINTNVNALFAQNAMKVNSRSLSSAMEQLSTGSRINSAKDDAAGLAISSSMTSQIRGLNQAVRNANDGISMLQTAEGAMVEQSNMLQRMRELGVQASSDTLDADQKGYLKTEFDALATQIDSIATQTKWNGMNVLTGVGGPGGNGQFNVTVTANGSDAITLEPGDTTTATLQVDALDITTAPADAVTKIDDALKTLNGYRANIGANINRLTYASDNLSNVIQNTTASRSQIQDTDYATVTTQLARSQIISQAATAMLAQANQSQQSVLALLK